MAKKPTHPYTERLAFERLLLLIATLLKYPGIGSPDFLDSSNHENHDAITAVCDQVQYKNSYLNRVKKQSTMIKPIESIFISNSINRHSNCLIKSIKTTSFCRT